MLQKLVRSDYYNEEYPLNEQEYKGSFFVDANRVQFSEGGPLLESAGFAVLLFAGSVGRQEDASA